MKYANYVLQLFFVRITRCERMVIDEINIRQISIVHGGGHGIEGLIKSSHREHWYTMQGFIVPFTGWNGDMKFLGKKWFFRITENYNAVA